MFSEQVVKNLLDEDLLDVQAACKLLHIYIAPCNWREHINELYVRQLRRHDKEKAAQLVKEIVSFVILLPTIERGMRISQDSPQRLLFGYRSFSTFDKHDSWFEELKKIVREDQAISKARKQVIDLGIFHPMGLEFQPLTHQSYRWLIEKARADKDSELATKDDLHFRRLVSIYGGQILTYMFTKHGKQLNKYVVNWRTRYFVEKAIHDVYSLEQILTIKAAEISKSNKDLIQRVKQTEDSKELATTVSEWF